MDSLQMREKLENENCSLRFELRTLNDSLKEALVNVSNLEAQLSTLQASKGAECQFESGSIVASEYKREKELSSMQEDLSVHQAL